MSITITVEQSRPIIQPKTRKPRKDHLEDDIEQEEPLIDLTEALELHSKKLSRQLKRKSLKEAKRRSTIPPLLNLPPELLLHVLSTLRPHDLLQLRSVNQSLQQFIDINESLLARQIISHRYHSLAKCFPLPIALHEVDTCAHPALLSSRRQQMLVIHKKPYQHIPTIDETKICTCMACLQAWNNLCLILDFSHWQDNLTNHEPIPMIERGRSPQWNRELLEKNAQLVLAAMKSPLRYAAILHLHLKSINGTILRRGRRDGQLPKLESRPYHLTIQEVQAETDTYLSRSGPPSYEFPYHRDNYYSLEAYVPNRRWDKSGRWLYFADGQHDRDVEWTVARFTPAPPMLKREDVRREVV